MLQPQRIKQKSWFVKSKSFVLDKYLMSTFDYRMLFGISRCAVFYHVKCDMRRDFNVILQSGIPYLQKLYAQIVHLYPHSPSLVSQTQPITNINLND